MGADAHGNIGFVTDIPTAEFFLSPRNEYLVTVVWPGKKEYGLPQGQVRNFGEAPTEWERQETARILLEMKKEQGMLDEDGEEIEKEAEPVAYKMVPVMPAPKVKIKKGNPVEVA